MTVAAHRAPGAPAEVAIRAIETEIGTLVLGATPAALVLAAFTTWRGLASSVAATQRTFGRPTASRPSKLLAEAEQQLRDYLAGRRRRFELPMLASGTEFQCRVWTAVGRIAYGETRTYADIAAELGAPRASRAVGRANALNRLAIFVPCHRLVASDGKLAGYAGGLAAKARLLDLERRRRSSARGNPS